jgi:acetyltransferase-like isoleucine patch superfamily enzyme
MGESVVVQRNVTITCAPAGQLRLGDNVLIGQGCVIACGATALVVGDDSMIGEYSSIRNTDHGMARGTPIRMQPQTYAPIHVGSDVWIGRGCAVLAGVTIGDGAVIGANSVVTHDVEPYTIAVGAPARQVGVRR